MKTGADKGSPVVHELDTTDLTSWEENIFGKASNVFDNYLSRFEQNPDVSLNTRDDTNEENTSKSDEIFEFNKCEICDRVFVNKDQWTSKLVDLRTDLIDCPSFYY